MSIIGKGKGSGMTEYVMGIVRTSSKLSPGGHSASLNVLGLNFIISLYNYIIYSYYYNILFILNLLRKY